MDKLRELVENLEKENDEKRKTISKENWNYVINHAI